MARRACSRRSLDDAIPAFATLSGFNAALFGDEMASSHRRTCRGRGIVQRFLRPGLLINFPMAYLSWGTRNARRIGHNRGRLVAKPSRSRDDLRKLSWAADYASRLSEPNYGLPRARGELTTPDPLLPAATVGYRESDPRFTLKGFCPRFAFFVKKFRPQLPHHDLCRSVAMC
jgi:hypothetical protein